MARLVRTRSRRPRKRTVWENLAFNFVHIAGASVVFGNITPEPMQTNGVGTAKILRMIGHIDLFTQVITGPDDLVMSFGAAVVTQDAAAVGTLPDPEADFQHAWYYWTRRMVLTTGVASHQMVSWDFEINTQRVLRSGYEMVFISETPSQEQATNARLSLRNLWEID